MELPPQIGSAIDELRAKLSYDDDGDTAIELEARIDQPRLNASQFYRALTSFYNIGQVIDNTSEIDFIKNTLGTTRYRQRTYYVGNTPVTQKIAKTRVVQWRNLPTEYYGIVLNLSTEKPEEFNLDLNQPDIIVRNKQRTSFKYKNEPWRFDFSATRQEIGKKTELIYEIEVELLNTEISNLQGFKRALNLLFQVVFETPNVYTFQDRLDIFTQVNKYLDSPNKYDNRIDLKYITQARNLSINDLKYGALVGGSAPYYATVKADGYRRFLLVKNGNIWLIGPPNTLILLSGRATILLDKRWNLSLFECEEIPISNRTGNSKNYTGKYVLIYDCLVAEGVSLIQQSLNQRMSILGEVRISDFSQGDVPALGAVNTLVHEFCQQIGNNPLLMASPKLYYPLGSVPEFYSSMLQIFDSLGKLPYKNDGLIFTPATVYLPLGQGNPDKTKYLPEVLKWKPARLNTFDVLFENDGFYTLNPDFKLHPFKPDILKPDNIFDYTQPSKLYANFKSGLVYEIGWDANANKFEMHRIRYNKTNPNATKVANDAFNISNRPIDEATLRGEDMTLYRRYHNTEKSIMLAQGQGILLDLGSGKFGDLAKWNNYRKVYTVEPDAESIKVGLPRLASNQNGSKVVSINARAENTAELKNQIPEQVDTIAMMMSLTFFFKDEVMLDQLINTIDEFLVIGGKLLITTMEGSLVTASTRYYLTSGDRVLFPRTAGEGGVNMRLNGNRVDITISDTSVNSQTEYLTNMPLFTAKLARRGITLDTSYLLDGQIFLNPTETALTRLYAGLIYTRQSRQVIQLTEPVLPNGVFNNVVSPNMAPTTPKVEPPCPITPEGQDSYEQVKLQIVNTVSKNTYEVKRDGVDINSPDSLLTAILTNAYQQPPSLTFLAEVKAKLGIKLNPDNLKSIRDKLQANIIIFTCTGKTTSDGIPIYQFYEPINTNVGDLSQQFYEPVNTPVSELFQYSTNILIFKNGDIYQPFNIKSETQYEGLISNQNRVIQIFKKVLEKDRK